jgi:hypothetical protein
MEEAFGLRQRLAYFVQQIAQIRERLDFCGIRPKKKGQMFARLGRCVMEHQIRQERLLACLIYGQYRLTLVEKLKAAQ